MSLAADLLAAHDEDLRTQAELTGASDLARIGPLWLGRFGGHGFVTYRDLAGEDPDALIRAAIEHFAVDPKVTWFEWKTRGHDQPPDLAKRLLNAGLVAEPAETVMIGRAEMLAQTPPVPAGVELRRAGDGADLAADVAAVGRLHQMVFGDQPPDRDAQLLRALTEAGAENQLWLAVADGAVVSAGRLTLVAGTRFAGLFGGATDPPWRHRGVYRALTAVRARAARDLGASLIYAECTEFSRPILERSGLVAVTTTTPYLWRR